MTYEPYSAVVQFLDRLRLRDAAVMFVDLDNFTRICAEDPPEQAFRLVRNFQRIVTNAVSRCKGRLSAYLGDGAMAIFVDLAATGRTDCATRALRCAHAILHDVPALSFEHVNAGGRPVSISIGLQYGQALFGLSTGSRWFGRTVIGDTVNVANRLEQQARALRAKLVVGDALVQKARREAEMDASELAQFEHFGPLPVDGRDAPVDVWAL
jgi:adenylate cyclase